MRKMYYCPVCESDELDMLPEFSGHNLLDRGNAYVETLRYFNIGDALFSQLPDCYHLKFVETHVRIFCPEHSIFSALLYAIINVVLVCAKKQVIGINARGVVAFVQHIQSIRDWAVMKLITDAVSKSFKVELFRFSPVSHAPVSLRAAAGGPLPTVIRAVPINLFPEAICKGANGIQSSAVSIDKPNRLPLDVSFSFVSKLGNWCRIAAPAFAKFGVWKFGLDKLWGMLLHAESCLSGFGLTRERVDARCPVFLLVATRSIIA